MDLPAEMNYLAPVRVVLGEGLAGFPQRYLGGSVVSGTAAQCTLTITCNREQMEIDVVISLTLFITLTKASQRRSTACTYHVLMVHRSRRFNGGSSSSAAACQRRLGVVTMNLNSRLFATIPISAWGYVVGSQRHVLAMMGLI